ncbi:MAG: VOC family protein [Gemmatimonadales bacterium]
MSITGLHHITAVCAYPRRTVAWYTEVLGLRLVKRTVNFDDPGSHHLYFGNQTGAVGSAVTFFDWRHAKRGRPGIGGTHHFALHVASRDGLLKWKRRVVDLGGRVTGPLHRNYFESIYLTDPDGTIVEIATTGDGWAKDEAPDALGTAYRPPPPEMVTGNRDKARIEAETWPEPVPVITPDMTLERGLHHITAITADIHRTHQFLHGLLGLRLVKQTSNFDDPGSLHWYWGVGDGRPGTLITYFQRDPAKEPRAAFGAGQTHHYAFAVPDEQAQLVFRERLLAAGLGVSPVMDRIYFKSIYTSDPDGHIVELATATPGFAVDEPVEGLGTSLKLPPWLEARRDEIETSLSPLHG